MVLLEQIKAQKVEASNGNLKAENERLRDDLESHVDKVADLEMTVQEQRESIQEMEDERDQLRKANEKLRLDLEAITEKGQVLLQSHLHAVQVTSYDVSLSPPSLPPSLFLFGKPPPPFLFLSRGRALSLFFMWCRPWLSSMQSSLSRSKLSKPR